MNGRKVITPKPETEEYNVRSFIYSRYRPFHPRRLFSLLHDKFILQMEHPDEGEYDDEDEDEDEDEDHDDEMTGLDDDDGVMVDIDVEEIDSDSSSAMKRSSVATEGSSRVTMTESSSVTHSQDGHKDVTMEEDPLDIPDNDIILQNKRSHSILARLFRSKGEFFLATRPHRAGDWSQAGAMLTLTGGRPWFCTLPAEEITTGDAEIDGLVQHDISKGGEWGDRRQELVFIGENLDHEALAAMLDKCLLTDQEYKDWQRVMRNDESKSNKDQTEALQDVFPDGFPDWSGDNEDDHDHEGHDHAHPTGLRSIRMHLDEVS